MPLMGGNYNLITFGLLKTVFSLLTAIFNYNIQLRIHCFNFAAIWTNKLYNLRLIRFRILPNHHSQMMK